MMPKLAAFARNGNKVFERYMREDENKATCQVPVRNPVALTLTLTKPIPYHLDPYLTRPNPNPNRTKPRVMWPSGFRTLTLTLTLPLTLTLTLPNMVTCQVPVASDIKAINFEVSPGCATRLECSIPDY